MRFVHPQKAGERNFFHPVSRNPWEVIISGPVKLGRALVPGENKGREEEEEEKGREKLVERARPFLFIIFKPDFAESLNFPSA